MTGRGAWPNSGLGGTKKYKDSTKPGPYYYLGSGYGKVRNNNDRAVRQAVKVYQRMLNREINAGLRVDGKYGDGTREAMVDFQNHEGINNWGGIGPETSEYLLRDYLKFIVRRSNTHVPPEVVSGIIRTESTWDVGCVGYLDSDDVGLAQINADAHPDMSFAERIRPKYNFQFIIDYLEYSLNDFDGNLDNAIASYNLGRGGARTWIRAGRPNRWRPSGSTVDRFVWDYINKIKAG